MIGRLELKRWMNMTIDDERPFTEDMKRMVAEQKLAFVATVCPDGTLHSVVELCACRRHGGAGIPKPYRSPRTVRSGYLRCDRRSLDRARASQAIHAADIRSGCIGSPSGKTPLPTSAS
jgi:hypothetical protein